MGTMPTLPILSASLISARARPTCPATYKGELMEISVLCSYRAPKAGLTLDECEDQLMVSEDRSVAAVSDGATESSYSRLWAQCLVDQFREHPTTRIDARWLLPATKQFVGR